MFILGISTILRGVTIVTQPIGSMRSVQTSKYIASLSKNPRVNNFNIDPTSKEHALNLEKIIVSVPKKPHHYNTLHITIHVESQCIVVKIQIHIKFFVYNEIIGKI